MPIRVLYIDNTQETHKFCTIRPTPFVSIDTQYLRSDGGDSFGVLHQITLNGTLVADKGMPFAYNSSTKQLYPFSLASGESPPTSFNGPYLTFSDSISHFGGIQSAAQNVPDNEALNALLFKQSALRALFAQDGQLVEISDFEDNEPSLAFYPRVKSINFQEGPYVDVCDYSIVLEADTLFHVSPVSNALGYETYLESGKFLQVPQIEPDILTEIQFGKKIFDYIESFSDNWSMEIDQADEKKPAKERNYILNHNLTAKGRKHYFPNPNGESASFIPAWEAARNFVQKRLGLPENSYPNISGCIFGSGVFNQFKSYNRFFSEQVDVAGGTYTLNDRFFLGSGIGAKDEFSISVSSSTDNPYVSVSIDGQIIGQELNSGSGEYIYESGAYFNARKKWNDISNSGQFGFNSTIYKRCNASVAVQLNTQATSISIGANEQQGTINYNVSFNNRPTNIISGVLAESINISDTYPGDVFSVIPIIGRKNGPILQYIGSRTEYKRDLQVSLTMDYTKIPYGSGRNPVLLKKPSVVEPTASQLSKLINEFSPAYESGIRKYFISPPTETWNPKEGTYNLNISWTYELEK